MSSRIYERASDFLLGLALIENNHGDMVHFSPSHAEFRQNIESPFCAKYDDTKRTVWWHLLQGPEKRDWRLRSAFWKPVDPVEFSKVRSAGVNSDPGSEIGTLRRILGEKELLLARTNWDCTFAPFILKMTCLIVPSWAFRISSSPFPLNSSIDYLNIYTHNATIGIFPSTISCHFLENIIPNGTIYIRTEIELI